MTEVLKNQDTNNNNGWESLTELNKDEGEATWEDVAKLGETGVDNSSEEDQIPLVELDLKEQAKLGRNEYILYISQPEVFAKVQRIKQEDPKIRLTELTQQLAQYYDPGYSSSAERVIPALRTLEDLADIYSTLQDDSLMLQISDLLERNPEDIGSLRRVFDSVSAELFPRENEKTRQSLVSTILQKIRSKHRKESAEMRLAELEKRRFLVELVTSYSSENTKPESMMELTKIYRKAIDEKNEPLSKFIRTNVNSKESTDDLLHATRIFQEIPEDGDKKLRAQQGYIIEYFYETGGMRNYGEKYLMDVILPLSSNGILSSGQNALLKTAIAQGKSPEQAAKMDYALNQLMPELMQENIGQDETSFAGSILATAVSTAKDQPELADMSKLAKEELIPFAIQQNSRNQCRYAERLLYRHLKRRAFQAVHQDGLERAQSETAEIIEKCNTLVMPLLKESSDVIEGIEWKLADEAYAKGYEEKFMDYLRDDLFPRVHRGDMELGGLLRNTNLRGEDRIAEYEFHCVTAKINPRNLNDLLMQRRELPTINTLKLEQNRVDALAIENIVIPDHGFIHDEHPMMHDVILAMVEYYDSAGSKQEEKKKAELQKTIKAMRDYGTGRYGDIEAKAFDLQNYEKIIKGEVSDDGVTTRTYNVPAIDVLRRLEKNTRPDTVEKPIVNNTDWQKLIDKVEPRIEYETGQMKVDWQDVGKLVEYTNRWLISKQNQYGLTPAKVEAIAYAERMATLAMRGITESERVELPYDDVFKEFVRFQELIGGYEGYNEEKFEEFYSGFQRIKMDAGDRDLQEHFAKLQLHVLERNRDLTRYYKKNGKAKREYMMQSNSLLHELVGLTEVRDARTLRERANQMARGISYDKSEDLADETR